MCPSAHAAGEWKSCWGLQNCRRLAGCFPFLPCALVCIAVPWRHRNCRAAAAKARLLQSIHVMLPQLCNSRLRWRRAHTQITWCTLIHSSMCQAWTGSKTISFIQCESLQNERAYFWLATGCLSEPGQSDFHFCKIQTRLQCRDLPSWPENWRKLAAIGCSKEFPLCF